MVIKFKNITNSIKLFIKRFIKNRNKIGASFCVYDGLENLKASIESIRNQVDYINVVYNRKSYQKENSPIYEYNYIKHLKALGLIDKIILFECNYKLIPGVNEANKRDIGLQDCKKHKCKYFLSMDCDECYDQNQFLYAKNYIIQHNITSSACLMFYYLKSPYYRLEEPREYYVPFLQKIYKFSHINYCNEGFCLTDPTRLIKIKKNNKTFVFSRNKLIMHHYSFIRINHHRKFNNNSSDDRSNKMEKIRKDFIKRVISYKFPNTFTLYNNEEYHVIKSIDTFGISESNTYFVNFINSYNKEIKL